MPKGLLPRFISRKYFEYSVRPSFRSIENSTSKLKQLVRAQQAIKGIFSGNKCHKKMHADACACIPHVIRRTASPIIKRPYVTRTTSISFLVINSNSRASFKIFFFSSAHAHTQRRRSHLARQRRQLHVRRVVPVALVLVCYLIFSYVLAINRNLL